MAKGQKFADAQLLDAVERYAEFQKGGKIKITELVRWCRRNVPGLEEVRDYHFSRPVTVFDKKKGRNVRADKKCTQRIDEINKQRSLVSMDKLDEFLNTVHLKKSDPKCFFNQPQSVQRYALERLVSEFHFQYARNEYLRQENDKLIEEHERLKCIYSLKDTMAKYGEEFNEIACELGEFMAENVKTFDMQNKK